jgi:hypothetical protein
MADQNQNPQNQIPGTLRTLKTDLEIGKSNPQDRLQQAGNFVQARPEVASNATPNPMGASASIPVDAKPAVEKKDIPAVSTESKAQPNYSWSNMNSTPNIKPNSSFNPTSKAPAETKSGFSVLDDSIDLPLDSGSETKSQVPNPVPNPINFAATPLTPPTTQKLNTNTQNNQFDINSLNLQDDINDVKPKKSSTKGLISVVIVILLLGLIGGGVYFYFNISSNRNTDITTDDNANLDNNISIDDPTEITDDPSNVRFTSPLIQNSIVDIAFNDSDPIRRTITTAIADKSDTLIELNLTKDNNPVSLIDVADIMSITIPSIGTIENYRFYAYNQQGVYKLVAVLGLAEDQDVTNFVDNWSNSIPRDLAGFSINLPSRIVNSPEIKKSIITNNSGKVFDNYYYNYTSPSDSVDVSSYENFVLIASSQDSMRYILEQIR